MGAYIVRRTLLAVLTLGVVSFGSFVVIQLPEGDYIDIYIQNVQAESATVLTVEQVEELREEWGLNQPLLK